MAAQQPNPEEQMAQLEAYLKEVDKYSAINRRAYAPLVQNLDALNAGLFDELIELLPEETPQLDEIKEGHRNYKVSFERGKENIHKGGVLDTLFEEYKGVMKKENKTHEEVKAVAEKMHEAYVSLLNGILMIYQPVILDIYYQRAQKNKKYSETAQKIENLVKILKYEYKADELIERIKQEQQQKEAREQEALPQAA